MRCPVCLNSGRPMYCGHCVNTSPSLLTKLKIDLLVLREGNIKLKNQVEGILEYGLGQVEAVEHNHAAEKDQRVESSNIEGEILGQRLLKLGLLRSKRKNGRVKYRALQLTNRIKDKELAVDQLKRAIAGDFNGRRNSEQALLRIKSAVLHDKNQQISQIFRFTSLNQEARLQALRDWFVVRKRDSYDFPYSVAFLPVVSLKNFYKLPPVVAWGSISKMFQYVHLMSEILFCKLPCKMESIPEPAGNEKDQENGKAGGDLYSDETNVAEYLTKLVINAVQLARHANLLSKHPIDLAWTLDQDDLDTLFYNMATATQITSRPVTHHWTYSRVLSVVSDALQLSIYAASPASRQTLGGTRVNNSDLWSLVG